MPTMMCACGHMLSFTPIPCEIEWLLIRDTEFDELSSAQGDVDAEDIYRRMKSLLRCPECDRLWVFWDGFGEPPHQYVRAESSSGG